MVRWKEIVWNLVSWKEIVWKVVRWNEIVWKVVGSILLVLIQISWLVGLVAVGSGGIFFGCRYGCWVVSVICGYLYTLSILVMLTAQSIQSLPTAGYVYMLSILVMLTAQSIQSLPTAGYVYMLSILVMLTAQ